MSATSAAEPFDAYVETIRAKTGRRQWRLLGPQVRRAAVLLRAVGTRTVTITVAIQVAVALCAAGEVVLAKVALGRLLHHPTVGVALPPLIAFVIINTAISALAVYQGQRQTLVSEQVVRNSWDRLLAVTVSVPLVRFEEPAYYDRLQRIRANALTKPWQVVQGMISLAGGAMSAIGLIAALAVIAPILIPVLLIAAIPLVVIARLGGRTEYDFAIHQTQNLRQRYALLDLMSDRAAAKEVRASALADFLQSRHTDLYDEYLEALQHKVARKTRLSLLAALTTAVVASAAVSVLVALVSDGAVALSAAGAAVVAIGLLAGRIEQIFGGAAALLESGLFLRDLDEFLADAGPPAVALPAASMRFDRIEVRDLTFCYPGQDRPALSGVSFDMTRGEVVAVVGANGSGKTTLSKLMANLYDPSTGEIRWDGVPVAELDRDEVARTIAVLFQDFVRYEMSLLDNIAVGDPTAGPDRAKAAHAASTAGADDVVARLPRGFDAFLSSRFPNGQDLSTGQWQRVAMARAVFRDAPFVILDEPTAALDARAEAALYRTVREVLADRTVLLVTHRLPSAMTADRILVLDGGMIVETGTHAELMRADGQYAELFRLQAESFGVDVSVSPPRRERVVGSHAH